MHSACAETSTVIEFIFDSLLVVQDPPTENIKSSFNCTLANNAHWTGKLGSSHNLLLHIWPSKIHLFV